MTTTALIAICFLSSATIFLAILFACKFNTKPTPRPSLKCRDVDEVGM